MNSDTTAEVYSGDQIKSTQQLRNKHLLTVYIRTGEPDSKAPNKKH